jgi:hypothetical protein
MRVIPFPTRRNDEVDPAIIAELEAAFDGDGTCARSRNQSTRPSRARSNSNSEAPGRQALASVAGFSAGCSLWASMGVGR